VSSVYVALIEVRPLPGCFMDPSETAGAAVRCYIPATSDNDALDKLRRTLAQTNLALVSVEWCVTEDEVEWETPNDSAGEEGAFKAKESGIVVFGEFHVWGHDGPDGHDA
jgi:hypothetical protein